MSAKDDSEQDCPPTNAKKGTCNYKIIAFISIIVNNFEFCLFIRNPSFAYKDNFYIFSDEAHAEYEYPESTYEKNPLLTNAAQSVLEFGYLPKTIKEAISNIIGNIGSKKYLLY